MLQVFVRLLLVVFCVFVVVPKRSGEAVESPAGVQNKVSHLTNTQRERTLIFRTHKRRVITMEIKRPSAATRGELSACVRYPAYR